MNFYEEIMASLKEALDFTQGMPCARIQSRSLEISEDLNPEDRNKTGSGKENFQKELDECEGRPSF